MNPRFLFLLITFFHCFLGAQHSPDFIDQVDVVPIHTQKAGTRKHYWLRVGSDMFGRALVVPLIVIKGNKPGKVMGITAGIHGNELNGIPVIHGLAQRINPEALKGVLIAIPGLNPIGMLNNDRLYSDQEDLNRVFPGKENGNESQQIAYTLGKALLEDLDFLLDLHTASFGRVNSMYVRADLSNDTLLRMARALAPDIILNSKGATAGNKSGGTLREIASIKGIKSITLEMGDPQILNSDFVSRGKDGIENLLIQLDFLEGKVTNSETVLVCDGSYWIYTDAGGFLEVMPEVGQRLQKGEIVAVLKDAFGTTSKTYIAPEEGVVIGKSTNPTALSGARILHLGLLQKKN
jgi:predicted deacylase